MTRLITDQDLERTLRVRSTMQDPCRTVAAPIDGGEMKERIPLGKKVDARREVNERLLTADVTRTARERHNAIASKPVEAQSPQADPPRGADRYGGAIMHQPDSE